MIGLSCLVSLLCLFPRLQRLSVNGRYFLLDADIRSFIVVILLGIDRFFSNVASSFVSRLCLECLSFVEEGVTTAQW